MYARALLLAACNSLLALPLAAQPVLPGPLPPFERSTPARFEFSPAGARALGLGGAFVAVADDATAADSNPAGLAGLEEPQLLLSLGTISLDTEFVGGFAPDGAESGATVTAPVFLGYVHPLGRITLGGYYQQDARYESSARFEQEIIILDGGVVPFDGPLTFIDERRFDQRLETLGVAAGIRLWPAISLGGALRYQQLSMEWLDLAEVRGAPFGPPPPVDLVGAGTRTVVAGDDTDVTLVLGLLVHPEGRWSGGLSYRQGGTFVFEGQGAPIGFLLPHPVFVYEVKVPLPDVYSAGAAVRPGERWLVSAQVSRLTYADLARGTGFDPRDFTPMFFPSPFGGGTEPIDDETQVHLGAELRTGSAERPVAFRFGAWTDPDHDGIRRIDTGQVHLALGAGTVLGERWSLDGALRLGETVNGGTMSLGFRP